MEALRTKITKEADIVRKIQIMVEQCKRDVATFEPRIDKALAYGPRIDKINNEVTNLESNIRIESEKTTNELEMFSTTINLLENKVQTYC